MRQIGSDCRSRRMRTTCPSSASCPPSGAQELNLFAHYGAGTDEYGEVEVRKAGIEALALNDLSTPSFVSRSRYRARHVAGWTS